MSVLGKTNLALCCWNRMWLFVSFLFQLAWQLQFYSALVLVAKDEAVVMLIGGHSRGLGGNEVEPNTG